MGWGTGDNKKWQSSDFGRESMSKEMMLFVNNQEIGWSIFLFLKYY
jgi:hypothetical protein